LNFKKLGLLSNLRRARSPAESRCFGPEAIQRSASPIIVEGVQRDFARSAAGRPDLGHHVQIGIEPALEPSTLPTRTRPSMVRRSRCRRCQRRGSRRVAASSALRPAPGPGPTCRSPVSARGAGGSRNTSRTMFSREETAAIMESDGDLTGETNGDRSGRDRPRTPPPKVSRECDTSEDRGQESRGLGGGGNGR